MLHFDEPLTLVGGSGAAPEDISTALAFAPRLIAADGGAAAVLEAGYRPEHVIGDMDSLPVELRDSLRDVLSPVAEQDTTDFEKCLLRVRAPRILALGVMGGRLDHQLAVLNVLSRYRNRQIVLFGTYDVAVLLPPRFSVRPTQGARLSLMPLGEARVWSEGLRWNVSGQPMAADGFLSISNEVAGAVQLHTEGPVMLVLPAVELPAVWAGLDGR